MLTRKQQELLLFIHERMKESGVPPSFDEINRFGKMCKNIRRALVRSGRIPA